MEVKQMIKVDKQKITINGKAGDIISELAYALVHICKRISEEANLDFGDVYADVASRVMTTGAIAVNAVKEEA